MLMSLTPRITPRVISGTARRVAAACGAGVLLLGASACGGEPAATGAQDPGYATDQNSQGAQTQTGPGTAPGANGMVAAVDGSTAQVQSQDAGQVAVSWTASTTFTKQVTASLDDVQAGDCVMVEPTEDSSTGSNDATTAVTAASVRITAVVDGSCTPSFRGGSGGPPGGTQDAPAPPTGAPGDGNGTPQIRGLGGAFGEVTAVTATGFTVKSTRPTMPGSDDDAEEVVVTVTVDNSTTYTTTAKGSADDVKVGTCLRAEGSTGDTGSVTATTVALTPAENGECGTMMFRRDGGPSGSGPGSTDSGSTQES